MDKYSWFIIILLTLAVLLCIILKEPAEVKPEKQHHTYKPIFQNLSANEFYDHVKDKDIDVAVDYLQRKSKDAKRIIPQFPSFPENWLSKPDTRGKYSSIGERYCIEFLELLFPGYKFTKIRPKWLRNPKTNRPLELDGYCKELSLAIEYQGKQHYEWPNFTNCSIDDFFSQKERDNIKEQKCIENNICLIRIPYTVKIEKIPLAIYAKLLDAVPELES